MQEILKKRIENFAKLIVKKCRLDSSAVGENGG